MISSLCTEQVKAIIAGKLGVDENTLSDHTGFADDLAVDSLDFVEIIWEVEKKFKISIPDEEAEKITHIGALIAYVEERV